MKTRAELYGREAAMLLRDITMYHVLTKQQLLRLYPMQQGKIEKLLSYLTKQGRIYQASGLGVPGRKISRNLLNVEIVFAIC